MPSIDSPRHYYIVTGLASFKQGEAMSQYPMNVILDLPSKNVRFASLKTARISMIKRLLTLKMIESAEQVFDFTFLGASYLGHMRPDDFMAEEHFPDPAESVLAH